MHYCIFKVVWYDYMIIIYESNYEKIHECITTKIFFGYTRLHMNTWRWCIRRTFEYKTMTIHVFYIKIIWRKQPCICLLHLSIFNTNAGIISTSIEISRYISIIWWLPLDNNLRMITSWNLLCWCFGLSGNRGITTSFKTECRLMILGKIISIARAFSRPTYYAKGKESFNSTLNMYR